MVGIAILVFITETAIKTPNKYAPLSPRKIFAFGKLNTRKFISINIAKNRNKAKSPFPFKQLIKNKFTKIINE